MLLNFYFSYLGKSNSAAVNRIVPKLGEVKGTILSKFLQPWKSIPTLLKSLPGIVHSLYNILSDLRIYLLKGYIVLCTSGLRLGDTNEPHSAVYRVF